MLAYALLMHEWLYLCRDGSEYVLSSFLPTLGLRLSSRAYAALHVAFMGVCVALLLFPSEPWLRPLLLATLTLVIASYSLRVSNHLVLAWFVALLLTLDASASAPTAAWADTAPSAFLLLGVRGLTVLTYAFAFLHKLNADYVSIPHSCATQLADFYCWDRGIEHPGVVRAIRVCSIYGTLLIEGLVPLLLLVPPLMPLGLVLALLFHFALGLLGIINFSAVMYAVLLSFLPAPVLEQTAGRVLALDGSVLVAVACVGALLAVVLTPRHANRHCPYVARRPAWALQALFGVVSAGLLLGAGLVLAGGTVPPVTWFMVSPLGRGLLVAVWIGFAVNGLSPYLGLKTEFSFAMFSNLRHEPWRHLLFPARWRPFDLSSYVRIERIEGLPELVALPPSRRTSAVRMVLFLLRNPETARYSSYFLRESVRLLHRAAATPLRIRITFTEHGRRFTSDDFSGEYANGWLTRLRAYLFPFMMQIDPDAPHSEQGTVRRENERQMF